MEIIITDETSEEISTIFTRLCNFSFEQQGNFQMGINWHGELSEVINSIPEDYKLHTTYDYIKDGTAKKKSFGKSGRYYKYYIVYKLNSDDGNIYVIHCRSWLQKPVTGNVATYTQLAVGY